MPISDLTERSAVLAAIREFDELGQDAFLAKYGYAPARRYRLAHDGKSYDSKAIVGAAFSHQFPERGPLRSDEFSGGEATVVPLLQQLGFQVEDTSSAVEQELLLTANDLELIRSSRARSRFGDLSADERSAYRRVHHALERLGAIVQKVLDRDGQFVLKLTTGFSPTSGVRGYLPKDLWFAVSNARNEEFVNMPQLFMIVSDRGIEYGFAASIHPSDFSDRGIQQRVRTVTPEIFDSLPAPESDLALSLTTKVTQQGEWLFRKKSRLQPGVSEFKTLSDWLVYLKSDEGRREGGGSISKYLSPEQLHDLGEDLSGAMQDMAATFSEFMVHAVPSDAIENPIQIGLESLLNDYVAARATSFGQHDALKATLNKIRAAIERLPAVRTHPQIRVSWSLGQGNWARIPWIALADVRETTSTQRGIYGAFLFPEDMSGVYLTLNQGVTDVVKELGRVDGREALRSRAEAIGATVKSRMEAFAFDNEINLQTDGSLGLDYQSSTIAYRFYRKGDLPNDAQLNEHLDQLLRAYAMALEEQSVAIPHTGEKQSWIFQANPKIYDVDGALRDLAELTWSVKGDSAKASVGDRVFLWRAGKTAGIVALATIIEAPRMRKNDEEETSYLLQPETLGGEQLRVRIRVDRRLEEVLSRSEIAAEARLKDLMILRFANYGTFKLSSRHAETLVEMIDVQAEPDREESIRHSSWIYAPGENAEYWDEFYEAGVIAIGWDQLGDLRQYGSIEDYSAALKAQSPDRAPVNNARACFDFARTIKVGDRIFAKRGLRTIVGFGTVVSDYVYLGDRQYFKNVRHVRWEGRGSWSMGDQLPVKTLTDITGDAELVAEIESVVGSQEAEPTVSLPAEIREPYSIEQALDGVFMDADAFERAVAIWRLKKNLILQGAPGVGKSFVAKRLAYALMGYRDPSRVRTVQFHQSYSYEDFVQGYRPSGAGLTLQQGVFVEFCDRARSDPDATYVFIIDEINRGNLSKIFGELMLLVEADKRSPEWATKLAYAPAAEERFYVPDNVFLLGMMNTADRSLSLVDYALRRRFAFITLRPAYGSAKFRDHLKSQGVAQELVDRIVDRMTALNEEVGSDKINLGPGFCIGHSFFVPVSGVFDKAWYQRVVDTEVVPLLEEYWFESPERAEEWRDKLLGS